MSNWLFLVFILFVNVLTVKQSFSEEAKTLLHINKKYFSSGEDIFFAVYSNEPLPDPVYAALLKNESGLYKLVHLVKIKPVINFARGHISIAGSANTGIYHLGIFSDTGLLSEKTIITSGLYVYNPKNSELRKSLDLSKKDPNLSSDLSLNESMQEYIVSFEITRPKNSRDDRLFFKGRLTDKRNRPLSAKLSVSIGEKHILGNSGNPRNTRVNTQTPMSQEDSSINSPDNRINTSRYIHGRLRINGKPAKNKKVYFYSLKENKTILDKYITFQDGEFWFLEPSFTDNYTIKLLTQPVENESYSYELLNQFSGDSVFHEFNFRQETFTYIPEFQEYADKKFLIDYSYKNHSPNENNDSSKLDQDMELISDIIYPDRYISFPTLPETIREIVPGVSIRYTHGTYEIRVFDTRAKNYCCRENPLIFVNNEPFMDVDPVMDLSPTDVTNIEVIKAVEAIKEFGDIGINGILRINLNGPLPEDLDTGRGKYTCTIAGYQHEKEFIPDKPESNHPDFRSFLYWNGNINTNSDGNFQFEFLPSQLESHFIISIRGYSSSGKWISENIDLSFPAKEP